MFLPLFIVLYILEGGRGGGGGGGEALARWPVGPSARRLVWSNSWFPGLFGALKSCGGSLFALGRFPDTKFICLGFATADPSFGVLSWALLDTTLCFLIERKWLHEMIERFMMFNKRRRWSHSSRVKFPLVDMSASWFFWCRCTWFWILGPNWCWSNNQSRATLCSWHVSHCWTSALNDHFDHSFVVFKKNVQMRLWEECAFVVTWSTCDNCSTSRFPLRLLRFALWCVFERGSIHDDQSMLVEMHDNFLNYDFRGLRYDVCSKGGSIHDDKAMLVEFFPNKSLDIPMLRKPFASKQRLAFQFSHCCHAHVRRKRLEESLRQGLQRGKGCRRVGGGDSRKFERRETPLAKLRCPQKDDVSWCEKDKKHQATRKEDSCC